MSPYKDRDQSRGAAKIRMEKWRKLQATVTPVTPSSLDVTPVTPKNTEEMEKVTPSVTPLFWYTDGKRVELTECPSGCKVLSDGQCWRPGNRGYHG